MTRFGELLVARAHGVNQVFELLVHQAIRAEEGSGIISVNGAAAHKASPGDLLIICAFGVLEEKELALFKPRLVYVDTQNRITHTRHSIPVQVA